ncbi:hypothetical protein B0H10DRAFT_2320365 [Mycena sp. CBHHK59/15]|nr:hypothetical protein B0H10DRAFT_2320365 [Mycena sp. CBHHK59/15]
MAREEKEKESDRMDSERKRKLSKNPRIDEKADSIPRAVELSCNVGRQKTTTTSRPQAPARGGSRCRRGASRAEPGPALRFNPLVRMKREKRQKRAPDEPIAREEIEELAEGLVLQDFIPENTLLVGEEREMVEIQKREAKKKKEAEAKAEAESQRATPDPVHLRRPRSGGSSRRRGVLSDPPPPCPPSYDSPMDVRPTPAPRVAFVNLDPAPAPSPLFDWSPSRSIFPPPPRIVRARGPPALASPPPAPAFPPSHPGSSLSNPTPRPPRLPTGPPPPPRRDHLRIRSPIPRPRPRPPGIRLDVPPAPPQPPAAPLSTPRQRRLPTPAPAFSFVNPDPAPAPAPPRLERLRPIRERRPVASEHCTPTTARAIASFVNPPHPRRSPSPTPRPRRLPPEHQRSSLSIPIPSNLLRASTGRPLPPRPPSRSPTPRPRPPSPPAASVLVRRSSRTARAPVRQPAATPAFQQPATVDPWTPRRRPRSPFLPHRRAQFANPPPPVFLSSRPRTARVGARARAVYLFAGRARVHVRRGYQAAQQQDSRPRPTRAPPPRRPVRPAGAQRRGPRSGCARGGGGGGGPRRALVGRVREASDAAGEHTGRVYRLGGAEAVEVPAQGYAQIRTCIGGDARGAAEERVAMAHVGRAIRQRWIARRRPSRLSAGGSRAPLLGVDVRLHPRAPMFRLDRVPRLGSCRGLVDSMAWMFTRV